MEFSRTPIAIAPPPLLTETVFMPPLDTRLEQLRRICQVDPGERGLALPVERNAFTERSGDLAKAAHALCTPDLAGHKTRVGILTGFHVPIDEHSGAFETDGPLGILQGAISLGQTLEQTLHFADKIVDANHCFVEVS